jgi:hypothetical protein
MTKIIDVKSKLIQNGLVVVLDGLPMTIEYPEFVWNKYPKNLKEALLDNLAVSSTFFVPQILNRTQIRYSTSRPVGESFLFKNGIYDMPASAEVDGNSSVKYLKRFVNTTATYKDNNIKVPRFAGFDSRKKRKDIVVPFTFGKDSLLSAALAEELGMNVHLVYYIEPAHEYEYCHKIPLIKKLAKYGFTVHTVKNGPGGIRYGKLWDKNTELGWGLQTTEYALLSLPFMHYWKADYIAFGNEHSCQESSLNSEGVLTYWSAYDQHPDWTPQQGLLASLVGGRKVSAFSFVEPLHEIAEISILHKRYPKWAVFQTSCLGIDKAAAKTRWCQNCEKCASMFAFLGAVGVDPSSVGFSENLFDRRHLNLFQKVLTHKNQGIFYAVEEEMLLALFLAMRRGEKGAVIDKFKSKILPSFKGRVKESIDQYFDVKDGNNIPLEIKKKVMNIFEKEVALMRHDVNKLLRR